MPPPARASARVNRSNARGRKSGSKPGPWSLTSIAATCSVTSAQTLMMIGDDEHTLAVTKPIFDGRRDFYRRATLLGREPA
ncbi:hypothetical protein JJ691_21220 [Kutzneria sp. CA-103260]|nr:hypothetical protein [Kutzneria sp. CA-103260]QUQ64402.1 hypothetical protein JJ691_21220 [Kutzneria sp. CA-103260]